MHAGIPPRPGTPREQTPPEQAPPLDQAPPPQEQTPPDQVPPGADPPRPGTPWEQTPPRPGTPPPRADTTIPLRQTATVADGTHPTGMHSCHLTLFLIQLSFYLLLASKGNEVDQ